MFDLAGIVSIVTAIGALIVSLVAYGRLRVERKKAIVDSKKTTVDMSANVAMAASELVDDYREEVSRLRAYNANLEDKNKKLKEENLRLSLNLMQSMDRISILESENERLTGGK